MNSKESAPDSGELYIISVITRSGGSGVTAVPPLNAPIFGGSTAETGLPK